MAVNLYFAMNFERLKRTFHIAPAAPFDGLKTALLCELAPQHVCVAQADVRTKALHTLSYYELGEPPTTENLKAPFQDAGIEDINKREIILSNASAETVVVPNVFFSENAAALFYESGHGALPATKYYDALPTQNATIVHALPETTQDFLSLFQTATVRHFYSGQVQTTETDTDQLQVHFNSSRFFVFAFKDGQLKIAQSYLYYVPADVLYYLLAICQQYNLEQGEILVEVSGLVSSDSAMITELRPYFSNLQFWKPRSNTAVFEPETPHFFSSMYNLAACAL